MKYFLFLAIKSQGKKARGFTLIELLVVVILLGVLAAISLPSLFGQIAKGRQAEARATLGLINRAQQGYRYEKGTFATLSELSLEAATISLKSYNISEVDLPMLLEPPMNWMQCLNLMTILKIMLERLDKRQPGPILVLFVRMKLL